MSKKSAFESGRESGLLHDPQWVLCRENLRKIKKAKRERKPGDSILEYWLGYESALKEKGIQ